MTWLWCGDTWLLAGCNTEMLCRTTPSHLVTGITTTSHSQPPTASISHQFLMSLKKPKLHSNISLDCGRLTRPEQTRKVAVERCGTTDSRSTCSQDLCEPWHWPACCLPEHTRRQQCWVTASPLTSTVKTGYTAHYLLTVAQ